MSILQNTGNLEGSVGELIYYEGGVGPLVGDGALDGRSDLSGGLAFHKMLVVSWNTPILH